MVHQSNSSRYGATPLLLCLLLLFSITSVAQEKKPGSSVMFQYSEDLIVWTDQLTLPLVNGKTTFTRAEQVLLNSLVTGKLRAEANDATIKSGFGRIKHLNGTYEDIRPHNGGIVKTLLDNVVVEVESESEKEPYDDSVPDRD